MSVPYGLFVCLFVCLFVLEMINGLVDSLHYFHKKSLGHLLGAFELGRAVSSVIYCHS